MIYYELNKFNHMRNKFSLLLALLIITSFSCLNKADAIVTKSVNNINQAHHDNINFDNVWARASLSPNPNSAIYLDIINDSDKQYTLIKASAISVADIVEIHQSFVNEKGIVRMAPIDDIIIPAHTTISLKPNGMHLMLLGLRKNLNAGDKFELILKFKENIEKVILVSVRNQ